MHRNLILSMMSCVFLLSGGCSILKPSNDPISFAQQCQNIHFFVKQAARIALYELNPSAEDLACLKSYLDTGKELLADPQNPDVLFRKLRNFVEENIPDGYQIFAFTIIDVIERYVLSSLASLNDDQVKATQLIVFGLDGAVGAVDEYRPVR